MKRYLMFAGQNYYPEGGWFDCRGKFDTLEEAVEAAKETIPGDKQRWEWWHVVDAEEGEAVDWSTRSLP
jgi:hypothetical protein